MNRSYIALSALVIVAAAACAPVSTQIEQPAAAPVAASDTMVSVGDHRLYFRVHRGTSPITILFEAGGGSDHRTWAAVPDSVARMTGATVVSYDRAGLGRSELGPRTLTPVQEMANLHRALEHLRVPTHTILVAHSYGAVLAIENAASNPQLIRGIVLVDPMNSRFVRATGNFIFTTVPAITNPTNNREHTIARMVATFQQLLDSAHEKEPALRQPITVITAGNGFWNREDIDAAWRRSHQDIAAAMPQRKLVVAEGSAHGVPQARPDLIIAAIRELIAQTRR